MNNGISLNLHGNIVTMLYPDVVYITLPFDGPTINIGVHGFTLRQLQTQLSHNFDKCCAFAGKVLINAKNACSITSILYKAYASMLGPGQSMLC